MCSANRGHWNPGRLGSKSNVLLLLLLLCVCPGSFLLKAAAEVGMWSSQLLQNQLCKSTKTQCVLSPLFLLISVQPTESLHRLRDSHSCVSSPFKLLHFLHAHSSPPSLSLRDSDAFHNSCLCNTVICFSVCQVPS